MGDFRAACRRAAAGEDFKMKRDPDPDPDPDEIFGGPAAVEVAARELKERYDRVALARLTELLQEHLRGEPRIAGDGSAWAYRVQLEAVGEELGQKRLEAAGGYHYLAVRELVRGR